METNALTLIGNMGPIEVEDYLKVNKKGLDLAKQVQELSKKPLKNQSKCDALNVGIGKVKKVRKFIEKCRKTKKSLYIAAGKEIDAKAKEIDDPFKEAEKAGVKVVGIYDDEQEKKHDEAVRKAEEANRLAIEAAEKETERRKKISESQNGNGRNIQPVPGPKKTAMPAPIELTQSTTHRTDLVVAVLDIAKVPPVFFKEDKVIEAVRQAVYTKVRRKLTEMGGSKNVDEADLPTVPGCKVEYIKTRIN